MASGERPAYVADPEVEEPAMPDPRSLADRAEREVAAACARGLPWSSLWASVKRTIGAAVPFDVAAFAATDPTTLLPTAGALDGLPEGYCAAMLHNELAEDDFDKLSALARAPRHAGILGLSTGGRPQRSARYRAVLEPLGLERQLRAACVAAGGCWAWIDVYRERGSREFTQDEARLLERLSGRLADALRVSLLLAGGPARARGEHAGLVLLGDGLEVVSSDAAADRWLAELGGAASEGGALPVALQAVAARARRQDPPGPARIHLRTRSGRWLVLHGFTPSGPAGVTLAIVIEPASPRSPPDLQVQAFGLTPSERRVLRLTLQGLTTKELAAALGISPFTARDHLTSVFDKTGARSRGQLFALFTASRPSAHALDGAAGAGEV